MVTTASISRPLKFSVQESLESVDAEEWNRLGGNQEPFLSHQFLVALERNGCVGETFGWLPRHLLVRNASGRLLGAIPQYAKTNSYGEFVFDWSWADAYQRMGLRYYPKLVASTPYTPVTGARLLIAPEANSEQIKSVMIDRAIDFARENGYSGLHWLFTNEQDTHQLQSRGMILRLGCQYHWHNNGYDDFEHFLGTLASRKRKKVRRERRRVEEQGITLKVIYGNEVDDQLWQTIYRFYSSIFARKFGTATLTRGFFQEIGRSMGEQLVLVLAFHEGRTVACAINFRSKDRLYGRIWGCARDYHSLHFEACYYQGIEYCIRHGLVWFEPGAQGEHKISRGFLPTQTWSAHWIANDDFRRSITKFCRWEQAMMQTQCQELSALSPYRSDIKLPFGNS